MDVLRQHLDDRENLKAWQHATEPPAVRLIKFDAWARRELATRLDWSWAGAAKERRIEQARIYLERLVLGLWRRGWMLDGRRLADRITGMLDTVATYQRAGKVRAFWPYFTATVDRYVGLNSEELQAEAMRAGAAFGQALDAILRGTTPKAPTLPELIAQRADEVAQAKAPSLRAQLQQERRRHASRKAAATRLPGL